MTNRVLIVTLITVLLIAGVVIYPEINPRIAGVVRLRTNSKNYYTDYPRLDQLNGPPLEDLLQLDSGWSLYVDEEDVLAVTNGEAGIYQDRPRMAGALRRALNQCISDFQDGKQTCLLPLLAVDGTGEEVILYLPWVNNKPNVSIRSRGLSFNNSALFPKFRETSRPGYSGDFDGVFSLREDYIRPMP